MCQGLPCSTHPASLRSPQAVNGQDCAKGAHGHDGANGGTSHCRRAASRGRRRRAGVQAVIGPKGIGGHLADGPEDTLLALRVKVAPLVVRVAEGPVRPLRGDWTKGDGIEGAQVLCEIAAHVRSGQLGKSLS